NGKLRHEVILLNRYLDSKLKRLSAAELHNVHQGSRTMPGTNHSNGTSFSISQACRGACFADGDFRSRKVNDTALQQRVFAIVRRQEALALTDESLFGQFLPFGFARQPK